MCLRTVKTDLSFQNGSSVYVETHSVANIARQQGFGARIMHCTYVNYIRVAF